MSLRDSYFTADVCRNDETAVEFLGHYRMRTPLVLAPCGRSVCVSSGLSDFMGNYRTNAQLVAQANANSGTRSESERSTPLIRPRRDYLPANAHTLEAPGSRDPYDPQSEGIGVRCRHSHALRRSDLPRQVRSAMPAIFALSRARKRLMLVVSNDKPTPLFKM
jgi:hypothetical protein